MNARRNLAVIRYSQHDDDHALTVQRLIRTAITNGRNVALLCETPIVNRMQRMILASLAAAEFPGRFAVVTSEPLQFSDAMPFALSDNLQVFTTEEAAFEWLDPNPEDADGTVLELEHARS